MISPTQQKKLEKLAKVLDGGDVALLTELNALEDRLDGLEGQIPDVKKALDRVESLVDGEKGDDGDDYILTENDKREIASFITVPIVEKVIEKREVIKEKPVVTKETTKEIIKEIREVKVDVPYIDNASIAYLEDEIKRVEDKIPEVIKQRETNFGFVIRDVVAGTGVTIDKTDLNRPIINATATGGSTPVTITVTQASYSVTETSGFINIFCDATANAITINLPTAVGNTATYRIKKTDSSVNTVTIDGLGGELIDGDATQIIQFQNTAVQIISNDTAWNIV